jgi:mRNA-degrading endonuclease YafQ of YafQ-DinJ toxin-antitoxin module
MVRYGPDWEACKAKYAKAGKWGRMLKQYERFLIAKMSNPTQMWNASDKRASNALSNFYKAHLTHDDSIIYTYDQQSNLIRIYGIWSHDEMGTGQPPNYPRIASFADRLSRQVFEQLPNSF